MRYSFIVVRGPGGHFVANGVTVNDAFSFLVPPAPAYRVTLGPGSYGRVWFRVQQAELFRGGRLFQLLTGDHIVIFSAFSGSGLYRALLELWRPWSSAFTISETIESLEGL